MVKINRDYVLKTFLDKVREAKRQDMKEIKVPVRFLDDLAYIIVQLMSEELSKAYESIENKPKEEIKSQLPISRKVLKEITPKKIDSLLPKEDKVKVVVPDGTIEKQGSSTYTVEIPTEVIDEVINEVEEEIIPEEVIPEEENIPEEIIEENLEENIENNEEEDDNTNIMYGGTW